MTTTLQIVLGIILFAFLYYLKSEEQKDRPVPYNKPLFIIGTFAFFFLSVYNFSVIGFFACFILFAIFFTKRPYQEKKWDVPHDKPVIFLGPRAAVRPSVLGHPTPEGYRLSCLYFGTGLMDRTNTLDQGFPYQILDPIPQPQNIQTPLARLCDQRAAEIVRLSRSQNKPIRMLWSGGIDSTSACIALLKQLADEPDRLEIAYSPRSRGEYWSFFWKIVRRHPKKRKIRHIKDALTADALIVTGEHGDQIFGSIKLLNLHPKVYNNKWEEEFPKILSKHLASSNRIEVMLNYLQPQFQASPVPIQTLYDLLWWMNFSMKWQSVALRMPGILEQQKFHSIENQIHHFFQTPDFQLWSMANPDKKIKDSWTTYKWPLKDYIFDFTNDNKFYQKKEKVPSLRGMAGAGRKGMALVVDSNRDYFYHSFDDSLREKSSYDFDTRSTAAAGTTAGVTISLSYEYNASKEKNLWEDLDGDE